MNIVIISHERSLNKAQGLLTAYKDENTYLITDTKPNEAKTYVNDATHLVISRYLDVVEIVKQVPRADKVLCVSENLLSLQSQLESFYGINNISAFAAEVLSNKQMLDDYCRKIGLGKYIPNSITPRNHNNLSIFKNKQIFSKPDIGTGSNIFYPGDDNNAPSVEYRRWNNRHHFLKHLKDKSQHNEFFELNRNGIHLQKFNYKSCRIMFQEYHWSSGPTQCPNGYVKDGKVVIEFYVKNSKIKYGETVDPNSDPVTTHSVSETSDITRERCVWGASEDEVDDAVVKASYDFIQTLVDELQIKDMFFVGPDFHLTTDRKVIAIDFNPRPGQFINILDSVNDFSIITKFVRQETIDIKNRLLWGCALLKPGIIKSIDNLETVEKYFNAQNVGLKVGAKIPKWQNLQNKEFSVNFDITGKNEQELFKKYTEVNQMLQDCITYE